MLDNYSTISGIARILALVPLSVVLIRHIHLMGGETYRKTKLILLFIIFLAMFNNIFTVATNFSRGLDGNLIDSIRHMSQVVNAAAALGTAIGWYILYLDDKE